MINNVASLQASSLLVTQSTVSKQQQKLKALFASPQ